MYNFLCPIQLNHASLVKLLSSSIVCTHFFDRLITFAHGIIKSIVKSIKMKSVVTVAGAPGTITFTGVGSNGGGTMVVKGTNDSPFEIQGNVT